MRMYIIFTLILSVFLAYIVVQSVLHNDENFVTSQLINDLESASCGNAPSREESLLKAKISSIRRLGEYEKKCNSKVTSYLTYEIIIPENTGAANTLATSTANALAEFSEYGITPVVYVKPSPTWTATNIKNFKDGKYDAFLDSYFQQLTTLNIDNTNIGYWVIFPEANLPYWDGKYITPEDFGLMFNKYNGIISKYYPDAKLGIMLSSSTYESEPFNWTDQEYNSLLPYIKNITKDSVDFVSVEGFPWIPAVNTKANNILDPKEYLNTKLAEELATSLNIKDIWITTGTFSAKYVNENEKIAIFPPEMRKKLLSETLATATELKAKDFNVKINISATDKTQLADYTDWSYWGNIYTENSGHENAIVDFLREANKAGIDIILSIK